MRTHTFEFRHEYRQVNPVELGPAKFMRFHQLIITTTGRLVPAAFERDAGQGRRSCRRGPGLEAAAVAVARRLNPLGPREAANDRRIAVVTKPASRIAAVTDLRRSRRSPYRRLCDVGKARGGINRSPDRSIPWRLLSTSTCPSATARPPKRRPSAVSPAPGLEGMLPRVPSSVPSIARSVG